MKKIVLIVFFISSLFSSNNDLSLNSFYNPNSSKFANEGNMTITKYNEMIRLLKEAYRIGDKSKAYIIGVAYSQEHILLDGVIKSNNIKAEEWLEKSFDAGYGVAAIQLLAIKYLPSRNYFGALDKIEAGLNKKFTDENSKLILSLAYGAIVLDNLSLSKKYVKKALDIIYPTVSRRAISSLDYIYANLLNLDKQHERANKYLNSACNNPNVSPEIWDICIRGKEIKTVNNKTGQIVAKDPQTNCPVSSLMPGLN